MKGGSLMAFSDVMIGGVQGLLWARPRGGTAETPAQVQTLAVPTALVM